MKRRIIALLLPALLVLGCKKRLDNFLFNPNNSINAYQLDANPDGDDIGEEYKIADSLIHIFTFPLIEKDESISISAIYVGDLSKIATDSVILYCHGNAGNMDTYWGRQKLLANVGGKNHYGVLQIDYPGYGLSTGKTTEANMYSSVQEAIKWLKNNGLTDDRFFMYGFSLGTAPVCELTSKNNNALKPSKIILEAPFAAAEVMIQDAAILNFPGSYFVNLKIDNAEEIKNVTQPLLWIHGTEDHFLSIKTHGEIVFKNYPGTNGEAIRVPNGDHSTVPVTMGYANYIESILKFLQQ
jgi:pimeloyl-ACP methyl ester carboxylesterase